ncbi:aminotransferase class IV [Herbiconiux sp. KACC 21604]|uniref:aminotransferase class IV n=1 Tax=unclassified Herbiconiux TaxID=2618217 RepID=UPI0014917999|nr:aminotransferase class IV [Herbiconiux sp. SALV-R1]QJU53012.1 hypothetical protein HL652_04765 [Herbiconiux sp. SALV-R1]WPO87944.1 aminotransferase class IV [Herbiconiux sp. KACC 21604]
MATAPATFVWSRGALVERELQPHAELLVADSWLVEATGTVRALDAHRDRFLDSVAQTADDAATIAAATAFWGAAIGRLKAFPQARLFPRVELARVEGAAGPDSAAGLDGTGLELRLRVRLAPRPRTSSVVVTRTGDDPRRVPRIKGPDLEHLIALRGQAQEDGADEIVLLHHGLVVDGCSAALLWWRGETLVAPSGDLARVASVTARSIRLIATATGTRVVEERARPADLEGCELWAVNALHGISVVEQWIDGPALAVRPSRAATWRKRLAALSRPL